MFAIGSLQLDMEYFLNNSTPTIFSHHEKLKQNMAKPSWENYKGKPHNNQP